jgi:small subunit ribosomal protein S5
MSIKQLISEKSARIQECGELKDKTVALTRVAKVVKGGRRFSFSALVVTGDGQGHVGFGTGKASEVPDAMRKASEAARKNLIKVPIRGSTIPHGIIAKFGASTIMLKPAAPGTGVVAGAVIRAIAEAAGIKDIRTKCINVASANQTVKAVIKALLTLKDPEKLAAVRGKSLEEIEYSAF